MITGELELLLPPQAATRSSRLNAAKYFEFVMIFLIAMTIPHIFANAKLQKQRFHVGKYLVVVFPGDYLKRRFCFKLFPAVFSDIHMPQDGAGR